MIEIDGSQGEGGGQIVRTSLALALITGQPLRIRKLRAGREKPGLGRQHLTAVRAAAKVGQARLEGAALGSTDLSFWPGEVRAGDYRFDTGTAGSASLVLQTVLPALWQAREPSHLTVEGGTHNPWAPPFDFLQKTFTPLLRQAGIGVELALERYGFYPAGGGRISATVQPASRWQPLELLQRGPIVSRRARALVSRLPIAIAEREVHTALAELGWPAETGEVGEVDAAGPGNVLLIEIGGEHITEVFVGFGRRGVPAETVARQAAAEARRYLEADVPVGEHLADQLLLPLALAGGGRFHTTEPTLHTRTNAQIIQQFLDLPIALEPIDGPVWQVTVGHGATTSGPVP